MNRGDKAALRLAIGLGLAVLVAYGMALSAPYVVCVMSVLVLSRPGPPLPLVKGLVVAVLFAVLVAIGIVMVPLLEHYAFAAVLMTAVVLHSIFFVGLTSGNPLTAILVMSFTLIPVAGVAEQALVGRLSVTLAVGVSVGVLVSAVSHSLFPDPPAEAAAAGAAARPSPEEAAWIALRATLIVMPVFVLALTDPSFYLAAVMKTVTLAQQAGETDARSAGRELVGATLMGAAIAAAVWTGLSIWPSLWMLTLWLVAAALWIGTGMFGVRRTKWRPSFWSNALITTFLLLGPAIEDQQGGLFENARLANRLSRSLQGGIVRSLAAELRAGGLGTALLAFSLGALHALTPGHGKAALAAYFLEKDCASPCRRRCCMSCQDSLCSSCFGSSSANRHRSSGAAHLPSRQSATA